MHVVVRCYVWYRHRMRKLWLLGVFVHLCSEPTWLFQKFLLWQCKGSKARITNYLYLLCNFRFVRSFLTRPSFCFPIVSSLLSVSACLFFPCFFFLCNLCLLSFISSSPECLYSSSLVYHHSTSLYLTNPPPLPPLSHTPLIPVLILFFSFYSAIWVTD